MWTRITPGKKRSREYKIEVSHREDKEFREVSWKYFMKIPDCSYEDLKTPSSLKKDNGKRAIDFNEDANNPNHYPKQIKEVWYEFMDQYQGENDVFHNVNNGQK